MRRADTLIVGGGPAGAAAAILLARAGREPLLLERRATPTSIVCGGFLGWDALAALRSLDIATDALGAVPIDGVLVVAGRRTAGAALPALAAGLSRVRLDEALLAAAECAGATVMRGTTVRRITGTVAELSDGGIIEADHLIAATGKYALRGIAPRAGGGSVGLRTAIPAPAGLAGTIELHLFRGGYAGLLVQEDGTANLCISVRAERLRDAGGRSEALIASLAAEAPALARLAEGADHWDAIANVPYGWRARSSEPGVYRVGDQAAVIASLAGDGVAIALASGRAAAEAIIAGEDASRYTTGFSRRAARAIRCGEAIRAIAESPRGAEPAVRLLGLMPPLARLAARLTRIGHR